MKHVLDYLIISSIVLGSANAQTSEKAELKIFIRLYVYICACMFWFDPAYVHIDTVSERKQFSIDR